MSSNEHTPIQTSCAAGTAGRVIAFVDGKGDERIAAAGERVPAEMLDFLPGD